MTLVAVSYGNSFVVVFCWAWPRSSCCFVALETKRKSGWGICGSSWFVLLWFCVMICHFHRYRPIALCTAVFTAYVVIRTVPQSINGQTRGKKNRVDAHPLSRHLAIYHPVPRSMQSTHHRSEKVLGMEEHRAKVRLLCIRKDVHCIVLHRALPGINSLKGREHQISREWPAVVLCIFSLARLLCAISYIGGGADLG